MLTDFKPPQFVLDRHLGRKVALEVMLVDGPAINTGPLAQTVQTMFDRGARCSSFLAAPGMSRKPALWSFTPNSVVDPRRLVREIQRDHTTHQPVLSAGAAQRHLRSDADDRREWRAA